jgi:cyclin-A
MTSQILKLYHCNAYRSDEFKLVLDTLYLAVILIDRFLSQKSINKKKLQLLGVTSIFIAS